MSLYGALAKAEKLAELNNVADRPVSRQNLGIFAGSITVAGGVAQTQITPPPGAATSPIVVFTILRAGVALAGGTFVYAGGILSFTGGGGYVLTNGDVISYVIVL